MAVTPGHGWRIPDLASLADGPDGFSDLALDIEATVDDKTLQSYTPSWTAVNASAAGQPGGTSSRDGKYRVQNGWCDVAVRFLFAPGVNGSYGGQLVVGLPIIPSSSIPEQANFVCQLYTPGIGWWHGFATCHPGDQNALPMFNNSNASGLYAQWQNADSNNTPGTGVPRVVGSWAILQSGAFTMSGRYYVG